MLRFLRTKLKSFTEKWTTGIVKIFSNWMKLGDKLTNNWDSRNIKENL